MEPNKEVKYKILNNLKLGRYLVAKENLQKGSLIFTDVPFVVGPKLDSPPLCLGCHKFWNKTYKCSRCGWPCCDIECESMTSHKDFECEVFSNAKVKFHGVCDTSDICLQFNCITPLRMLISKEKNAKRWDNEVSMMEDHETERRNRPTWEIDNVNITEYLRGPCLLEKRFSEKLIQKICGILEVNSVEIPSYHGPNIRGIYPVLAIMSHNCVPTVVHTILAGDNSNIPENYAQIWAADDIEKGEKLEICYTHVSHCTLQRRRHLKESKFFDCDCKRCSDPTELGTNLSSMRCNNCENGIILASDPLDVNTTWNCSICNFSTTVEIVHKVVETIQSEIDRIEENVENLEEALKWYQYVLHPKHSLLINLKYALLQISKKEKKFAFDNGLNIEHKIKLCNEVLQVLDVINPGETRMRGVLLYEMHDALVQLALMKIKKGIIDQDQFAVEIKFALKILRETINIFKREDEKSLIGSLAKIASGKYDNIAKMLNV